MRREILSVAAVSGLLVFPAFNPAPAPDPALASLSGSSASAQPVAVPAYERDTACSPTGAIPYGHECGGKFTIDPGAELSVKLTGDVAIADFGLFESGGGGRLLAEAEYVGDEWERLWTNDTGEVVDVVLKADPFSGVDSQKKINATVRVVEAVPQVSAADLLSKVRHCDQISDGKYRTGRKAPATVPVCDTNGAVFWKADMDIDCDGQVTDQCNKQTDPSFRGDTAFQQSNGKPLNAEELPYVVVPGRSNIWNYARSGIKGGGVVAVIYNNKVEYAVVGDIGPKRIIGEASYATAEALGIDTDPATGGVDSGVTYILFKNSKASPIENHRAAVSLGESLAEQFVQNN